MRAEGEAAGSRAARRKREATGVIRPYTAADREAVRDICRRTAYRNRGSDAVFEDGELFADYWTAYYTDHEPESCLVVEEDGRVIGYLIGCLDARRFQSVMARRIVPRIVAKALWRLSTRRYRNPMTGRMLRWLLTQAWREEPRLDLTDYPAHYHCNILREGYGKNYYTALALAFLDLLERKGVYGLHGQVEEAAAGGPWRKMVEAYCAEGDRWEFLLTAEKPSSFHSRVLGDDRPMVNRIWAASTANYRLWLVWMAKKYHM